MVLDLMDCLMGKRDLTEEAIWEAIHQGYAWTHKHNPHIRGCVSKGSSRDAGASKNQKNVYVLALPNNFGTEKDSIKNAWVFNILASQTHGWHFHPLLKPLCCPFSCKYIWKDFFLQVHLEGSICKYMWKDIFVWKDISRIVRVVDALLSILLLGQSDC